MFNFSDATTFTAQDGSTQKEARTSTPITTVPVQLSHHVYWSLRRRLIEPLHGLRPRLHRKEVLSDGHILARREVFCSQAERRNVALSCNARKNMNRKRFQFGLKKWNNQHKFSFEWEVQRLIELLHMVVCFKDTVLTKTFGE
jgi:hypothetical protein